MINAAQKRRLVAGGLLFLGGALLFVSFKSPQQTTGGVDSLVENPEDGSKLAQILNPQASFSDKQVESLTEKQTESEIRDFLSGLNLTYSTLEEAKEALNKEVAASARDILITRASDPKSGCATVVQCVDSSIQMRVEAKEKDIERLSNGEINKRQFLEAEVKRINEIQMLLVVAGESSIGSKASREEIQENAPSLYKVLPTVAADIRVASVKAREEIPRSSRTSDVVLKEVGVITNNISQILAPVISQDVGIVPCQTLITEMSPEQAAKCQGAEK